MNTNAVIYFIVLCVALASAETLHGIFRAAVLVPRIGKKKALKVAIITGSVLAYLVCLFFVPKMGISSLPILLLIGLLAALFMASFDVILAKLVLKRPLRKSLDDFDPRSGNYLLFGLILLIFYPAVIVIVNS